jgi:hypothetical protein
VVAAATCRAPLPALNRVPDPASRPSTQPVVEVWGTFMPVDLRRRSSRNWTSPNVLPICTPRGCTFFFSFFKMSDHLTRSSIVCHFSRHSSGRGGIANLTSGKVPHLEGAGNPHGTNHPHTSHEHDAESHGRGGRGNISRDHSREPGVRNTPHVPSGLAQSVTG